MADTCYFQDEATRKKGHVSCFQIPPSTAVGVRNTEYRYSVRSRVELC